MHKEQGSGFFVFATKLLIALFIFGLFPVFLTLVVRNYNHRAEEIIQTSTVTDTMQSKAVEDIKVLTQEDADALQTINQHVLGDWKNPLDPEYVLRFETDNSFVEFRNGKTVGYGLWRASVKKNDFEYGSEPVATDTVSFITPSNSSSYYIVRNQYEGGKKVDVLLHKVILLNDMKLTVLQADGSMIRFER
ncbi:MAG: hypothetical protein FGM57_01855 [Candidatus Taylorbacteria bacterium]|nr:hypothetical protein [Candidatus Taylorbacteria bacterium]